MKPAALVLSRLLNPAVLTPRRLAVLFLLPFLYGALRQVMKATHWFTDFETLSCSGHALSTGQALYGAVSCPGAQPTAYLYTPVAARLIAAFQASFGVPFWIAMYGGLFCAVVWGVARRLLADDGRLGMRAPFLAGMSASALHSGNVSIVIHGLISLGARRYAAWPVLLLVPLMVATIMKPTFAVYFALFLFLRRPLWQRLALAGAGGLGVLGYFLYFRWSDPALFDAWSQITRFYGLTAERGHGFLSLPGVAAMQAGVGIAVLYLIFAALMLTAGLAVARHCLADEVDRIALGISVCLLLYPRLMDYDAYTIPFGLAVAAGSFRCLGRFEARHLALALQGACLVFGLIGGQRGGTLLFDVYCLLLLFLGGVATWLRLTAAPSLSAMVGPGN